MNGPSQGGVRRFMKERYRERLTRWVGRSESPLALTAASIAESTVVPIPIELIITPMMIHKPARKWRIAGWTLLGSVLGTAVMFFVGLFAFQTVGTFLIERFEWHDEYAAFQKRFRENGILTVAFISATPIPLVLAALGAGAAKMNFLVFMAVVGVTRALRYLGLALLVQLFGERARRAVVYLSQHKTARIFTLGGTLVLGVLLWWATR
jgi:membrane protein YqaA with SNARE-associated domain